MFPVVTFSHISCGRTAFFVSINPERNRQPVVGKHMARGENLPMYIPTVVRESSGKIVAMAGHFMATMDRIHPPSLGWHKATIHSRHRWFATAAVRRSVHMAVLTVAMRHSQWVMMQSGLCSGHYQPTLGWYRATIHSRRRGFATTAVRSGVHMAAITIAMRHSQGVTMQ